MASRFEFSALNQHIELEYNDFDMSRINSLSANQIRIKLDVSLPHGARGKHF